MASGGGKAVQKCKEWGGHLYLHDGTASLRHLQEHRDLPNMAWMTAIRFRGNSVVSRIHDAVVEGRLLRDAATAAAKRGVETVRSSAGLAPKTTAEVPLGAEERAVAAVVGGRTVVDRVGRTAVIATLGVLCKTFMTTLNTTRVEGLDHLLGALNGREEGQPLITVSNHVAGMDDPLVVAALLPVDTLLNAEQVRWTMCATDRCFKNELMSAFFRMGKVLPVERGAGTHQVGMQAAVARLDQGDWVHIFPEGTRSKDGRLQNIRRGGVGRLVSATGRTPLVVPFYHAGMERVSPRGALVPLSVGNEVQVVVGAPLDVGDLVADQRAGRIGEQALYRAVAARVEEALRSLQGRADELRALAVKEGDAGAGAGAGAGAVAGREPAASLGHAWSVRMLPAGSRQWGISAGEGGSVIQAKKQVRRRRRGDAVFGPSPKRIPPLPPPWWPRLDHPPCRLTLLPTPRTPGAGGGPRWTSASNARLPSRPLACPLPRARVR